MFPEDLILQDEIRLAIASVARLQLGIVVIGDLQELQKQRNDDLALGVARRAIQVDIGFIARLHLLRIKGIPGQAELREEAHAGPDILYLFAWHAGLQGLELSFQFLLAREVCQDLFHVFRRDELLLALVIFCVLIIVLGLLRPFGALGRDTVGHALLDFLHQLHDANGNIFHKNPPFVKGDYSTKMA